MLASREDSEHGQILIRFAICAITLTVVLTASYLGHATLIHPVIYAVVVVCASYSLVLFILLLLNPAPSHPRRIVAFVLDYLLIVIVMIAEEKLMAFVYGYLMWITMGYGLRYGNRYLIAGCITAVITFTIIILATDYWKQNIPLTLALLLLLAAMPLYQAGLLLKSSRHNQRVATASEAKTEFLAKLSHELRTPLNGVVLLAEMLSSNRLAPGERVEAADTIQKEAMMMLGIVQQVLHVSEIESGRISVRRIPVNIANTVQQVTRLFKPLATRKGIRLVASSELDHDFWLLDEIHVRQVIVNLLSNAVKYTDQGLVSLLVKASPDGEGLIFLVNDTGAGMDAFTLANLFNPYKGVRLPPGREEGSGLGMHITKALVDAMDGTIEVTTELEVGTTAEIVLPAHRCMDVVHTGTAIPQVYGDFERMVQHHSKVIGSKWIMVIDDTESNLMIVSRLLQEGTHKIIPVGNPEEALRSVLEMSPDMILVDYHMPTMNAPGFIAELRSLRGQVGASIPVVVMTADATDEVRNRAMNAGATTVLHKPVQAADLFQAIEEALSFGTSNPRHNVPKED